MMTGARGGKEGHQKLMVIGYNITLDIRLISSLQVKIFLLDYIQMGDSLSGVWKPLE